MILVHDAARPLVSPDLVRAVAEAAARHGAAIPVLPVTETLKRLDGDLVGVTVDRTAVAAAQTPQGLRRSLLVRAYAEYPPDGPETWTDEASLLEACRIPVHAIKGEATNLKVTVPLDLERARALLAGGLLPGRSGSALQRPPRPPGVSGSASTAIPSDPASRSPWAVCGSKAPRAWPAIRTATWRSTPSPTRSSGRPAWATWAGSSRRMIAHSRRHRQPRSAGRSWRRRSARPGWATVERGPDDRRSPAQAGGTAAGDGARRSPPSSRWRRRP